MIPRRGALLLTVLDDTDQAQDARLGLDLVAAVDVDTQRTAEAQGGGQPAP